MSKNLSLEGQNNWNYYDGGDSPAGAYMGWLKANQTSLKGTIDLGKTLQPGNYYVAVKVLEYMGGTIELSMVGSAVTFQPNRRDFNGQWNLPVNIEITSATDNLVIKLLKTISLNGVQKYLIRGIYITSNPNEIVDRNDRIVNLDFPSVMDHSPPVKGNILENSSFEVGIGHGWGFLAAGYDRDYSLSSLWDNSVSFHGKASLKIPAKGQIISKAYHIRPNRKYTLSAWVRSTAPKSVTLEIWNVSTPPEGYPQVEKLSKYFKVNNSWQKVSLTGDLLSYPSNQYQIQIQSSGGVWIDAIQFEEGDSTDYKPKKHLEIGLVTDHIGNIFFEDEVVTMNLLAYNNSGKTVSRQVKYEIYDIFNRKVKASEINITVPKLNVIRDDLNLTIGRTGIFRVVLWVDNEAGTEEEVVFSVLPRPSNIGLAVDSMIGIHSNYNDFQFEILKKMGIKWIRAMSPGAFFRWTSAEPVEGEFSWYDHKIEKAVINGIEVLGTIGTNNYWPEWADNGGLPDLDKWENFVEQLVKHYKGKVKYWEIWNEPIYVFSSSFYTELLKRAANVIRRIDPEARIIGMGGVHSYSWILEVLQNLGSNWNSYMDYISTHLYPPNSDPRGGDTGKGATNFKTHVIDPYQVPVWNTETGVWDEGFYKGSNSNFRPSGEPIWSHFDSERYIRGSFYEAERLVINFLHSIGNGMTCYFYYDSRIYATPNYCKGHPTILEYDDTIRSKGVAYSILAHFFDYSKGLGNISNDPYTYAYLFDKGGTPLVALWANDKKHKSINLSISKFKVYDIMGNEILSINGSSIPYSRTPVYIEGNGISVEALKTAIQNGEINNSADNLSPHLSIDAATTGHSLDSCLNLRWLAIDDTSIPSQSNPEAVVYSYRLDGYDSNWSAWTTRTNLEYCNIISGAYAFNVKAKDEQGNISAVASKEIIIGSANSQPITIEAPKGLSIIRIN
jgi:hypothetical protein